MATAVQSKTPDLHPLLFQNVSKEATRLNRIAFSYNVLSKICYVATAAIAAVTAALAAGLIAPTGALSAFLFASILATAFFIYPVAGKCREKSLDFNQKAELEVLVAKELEAIKDWDVHQVKSFFKKLYLNEGSLPLEALQKLNKEPLLALLPLIARFRVMERTYAASCQLLEEKLTPLEKIIASLKEADRKVENAETEQEACEATKILRRTEPLAMEKFLSFLKTIEQSSNSVLSQGLKAADMLRLIAAPLADSKQFSAIGQIIRMPSDLHFAPFHASKYFGSNYMQSWRLFAENDKLPSVNRLYEIVHLQTND